MTGTQEETANKTLAILDRLANLTQELYENTCRTIRPTKGWVLVRILDREQVINGIIVPRMEQNKPMHEGIVLVTWEPWTEEKIKRDESGWVHVKVVQHRSELQPGDHVCFDHWAGVPVDGDQKAHTNFRLIREEDDGNLGGIKAIIEYSEKSDRPHEILSEMLVAELGGHDAIHDRMCHLTAHKIEHRFLLVDRDRPSVTLSGR
jgi:co-chaperonin GroES (HSP10)